MRYPDRCVLVRPHKSPRVYGQDFNIMRHDPDVENMVYQTDTSPIAFDDLCKVVIDWDDKKIHLKCVDNKGNILSKKSLKNKITNSVVQQDNESEES